VLRRNKGCCVEYHDAITAVFTGFRKLKLTISRKLLLGYLFMAFLTILASAYALFSLQQLSGVAYNLTTQKFVLVENSKILMDTLLAQEGVEKKYLILKDPLLEQIFWQRSSEFHEVLTGIRNGNLDPKTKKTVDELDKLQNRFKKLFSEEIVLLKNGKTLEAQALSDTSARAVVDAMASKIRYIQINVDQAINDAMNRIAQQGVKDAHMTIGIALFSLILGITFALILTRNISKPLKKLQMAAGIIAEGNLDHKIEARRDDEIGALAKSFAEMTQRLKVLEELNLDASPLTGLPGNLAIENKIEQMLAEGEAFSLCQVDLDNFKPFADKYGYAWGSEVIKEVASLLTGYTSDERMNGLFIGHIGGDDFVVIGNPDQVESICQKLVVDFEKRIMGYYAKEDAGNGYFIGKNRQGMMQKFPLITITAAIVTDDGSHFKNPLDMARMAAELKEYAKMLPGSNYVTEQDVEKRLLFQPQTLQSNLELDS
jgi:GGDEF domain-containing protein/CHASE3 domain sensor protein